MPAMPANVASLAPMARPRRRISASPRVMIAAVVVGGAAITGGSGTVLGTLLGVILLGSIGTSLTFLGISAYWEKSVQGAIILLAVAISLAGRNRD